MSYSTEVLADSPLVYLRLGDASGTTATDSSGNSHNGTYQNSPTLGVAGLLTGDTDTAVTLNGTNQYVSVAGGAWMAATDYTVEFWVKFTSSATMVLLSWASGTTSTSRIIEISNLSNLLNAVFYTSTGTGVNVAATASSNDGVRHHVVARKFGSSLSLWIDGTQVASTAAGVVSAGSAEVDLGRRNGGTFSTAGTFDELAVYGTALSNTRIQAHYTAGTTSGTKHGTASGTFSFAGSATGHKNPHGTVSGTFSFAGSVAGHADHAGTVTGTFSFAGSTTGHMDPAGTVAGGFAFAGAASGSAPVIGNHGAAAGTVTFTGSTAGSITTTGTTSGSFAWAGAAAGHTDYSGSAAGGFTFTGIARGPVTTPTARSYTVPAYNRSYLVPAYDRTYLVPARP